MFPVKKAFRRYAIEGFVALTLLGIFVRLSRNLTPQISDPALHAIAALLPLLPICLFALVLLRLYRAVDEMVRHQILIVIAGGQLLMLIVGMSYRWMPDAGLPPIQSSLPVGFVCIIVAAAIIALSQLMGEQGWRGALKFGAYAAATMLPILVYFFLGKILLLPPLNISLAFLLFCGGLGGYAFVREFLWRRR